jgi:hypothetical protein
MAEGAKYFVRASDDAPEKGPYGRKHLARSLEKGLLGNGATARLADSEEWVPLRDVVAAFHAERAEKRAMRSSAEMEHAMAAIPAPRPPNPLLWIGVVVGLAGVALSVGFAATGTSSGVWPVAVILGGVYMAIRGVIRGARREDDE